MSDCRGPPALRARGPSGWVWGRGWVRGLGDARAAVVWSSLRRHYDNHKVKAGRKCRLPEVRERGAASADDKDGGRRDAGGTLRGRRGDAGGAD